MTHPQTQDDEALVAEREAEAGFVVWHSSEEDGGPDVGITIGLGSGKVMWIGERSEREGGGQGILIYENGNRIANAGLDDRDEVIEVMQHVLAPALTALRNHEGRN